MRAIGAAATSAGLRRAMGAFGRESDSAMGTNQMDPATRIPAARAGFAQGQQEATRVTLL